MALPLKNRVKKKKDFNDLFKNGRTLKGRFLLIKYSRESSHIPKIGFIIQSKVVRKATQRNLIKRILAETVRRNLSKIRRNTIILVLRLPEAEFLKTSLLMDLNNLIPNLYA